MAGVTALPIHDRIGNALVGFRFVTEADLTVLDERTPLAASLVAVVHRNTVLMVFDSWRKQWELPGGTREPAETPSRTAARELREETGIHGVHLTPVAAAEFDLTNPARREFLAVYQIQLHAVPRLIINDEAEDFRWWPPAEPVSADMSPLDAEIARRVLESLTT